MALSNLWRGLEKAQYLWVGRRTCWCNRVCRRPHLHNRVPHSYKEAFWNSKMSFYVLFHQGPTATLSVIFLVESFQHRIIIPSDSEIEIREPVLICHNEKQKPEWTTCDGKSTKLLFWPLLLYLIQFYLFLLSISASFVVPILTPIFDEIHSTASPNTRTRIRFIRSTQ